MLTANDHGKGGVRFVTLSPCHLVTLSLLLAAGATAGARLAAPEPVSDGAARLTPTPAAGRGVALTSAPTPAAAAEYVQLQEALRARGVSWQHLEMSSETGEWKFTCTVADP